MRGVVLLSGLLTACVWGVATPTGPTPVQVTVPAPGASALEVGDRIGTPLEEILSHLPGRVHSSAISEDGRARLDVLMQGGDAFRAIQQVNAAVQAFEGLPDGAGAPRVHINRSQRLWLLPDGDAAAAHQAIGTLARQQVGAAVVSPSAADQVWELDPARLAPRGLGADRVVKAVDAALADGRFAGAATPVGEAWTLSEVATRVDRGLGAHAFVEGRPAVGIAVEGDAAPEGWLPFTTGATCAMVAETPEPALLATGRWVQDGQGFWGRLPQEALRERPGVTMWPCEAPVERIALLADSPLADLDGASASLGSWPGSLAVLPVPLHVPSSKLEVEVEQERAQAYGVSMDDVRAVLVWSGRMRAGRQGDEGVRIELRWPDRPEDMGRVRVRPSGTAGPVRLMDVATLRLAHTVPPPSRVDGRRARLVELVLAPGAKLSDWTPPPGIEARVVEGLGPQRVWR